MSRDGRRGDAEGGAVAFKAKFRHFRRILTVNNQVLELVADMERALGGEYIFDRAFLKTSVTGVIERCRQVIYHLNAMAGERYHGLYDRLTRTADHLTDILAGGAGPFGPQLVIGGADLHRDLGHLAGGKGANLGEVANALDIDTPPLFVVSVTGYRRFMEYNGLFDKIDREFARTGDPGERAAAAASLFARARLPADLKNAIAREVKSLRKAVGRRVRFAVRSSAVGEDGERSFAGQFDSRLGVRAGDVAAACVAVMAGRFSRRALEYLGPDAGSGAAPMAVVVQVMVEAEASGVLYTRDPARPHAGVMMISAVRGGGGGLVGGRVAGDGFEMERRYPFRPVASAILPRPLEGEAPVETAPGGHDGLRRGSGAVPLGVLRQLVETGLLLEKRFELPQDVEWCLDRGGRLFVVQARPLRLRRVDVEGSRRRVAAALAALPVVLGGEGQICQLGVAGGRVVHVDEETPSREFPVGAVAVCHTASPRLAAIVERAAAIITEIGGPTGHLATIAREYRTPALFGVPEAMARLPEGMEVMIDVEERTVYAGRVELPADAAGADGEEAFSLNPLASILRRLLRLIAPLNLVDPAAVAFQVRNCRTIHDILRFCHEKAIAELIDFHTAGPLMMGSGAPFLEAEIPIRVRLIDIGGGLAQPLSEPITAEQVTSRPLAALLAGMLQEEAWSREAAPFGMRDLLAGITRPLGVLGAAPAYSGENLAIVADNYCNLSLRLGYHFNIIDTFLSDDPDDNYIYFRFVGGFAEEGKRRRRARFIDQVLSCLHFKVERKGDLVLARAKMLESRHMESILARLGELIAFTRQLDVRMAAEADVDRCFSEFLARVSEPYCRIGDGA